MLRPSVSYLSQSLFWSLLHRKAVVPSLLHSLSSVRTWTPPKWLPRVAHGVLPASCAVSASSPSWWLLHPQGLKANIPPFLFNKMIDPQDFIMTSANFTVFQTMSHSCIPSKENWPILVMVLETWFYLHLLSSINFLFAWNVSMMCLSIFFLSYH